MGHEYKIEHETTAQDLNKWRLFSEGRRPLNPPSIKIITGINDKSSKSNVIMGTDMNVINRNDTSSGCYFTPKRVHINREHIKEITKEMRKTNFILGFKSDS